MKYSIKGSLLNSNEEELYQITDNFPIRQLVTSKYLTEDSNIMFTFEVWVVKEATKLQLYEDLKDLIDTYHGFMNWHECYHDELPTRPCEEPQEPYGKPYEVV